MTGPPVVGRERELARLAGLLDAAEAGGGRLVVLSGEPGIGKSRLAAELATAAAGRGWAVLSGRATSGGGSYRPVAQALNQAVRDRPLLESADLGPFRAALGRLLPELADSPPPQTSVDPTVFLGEAVVRMLRAVGSPTLLVLEDLHWADPDTLALLDYLAGAIGTSPILIATTARDDGSAASVQLRSVPGAVDLTLTRLDPDEADALIDERAPGLDPAIRQLVLARAEGVPLLIEELVTGAVAAQDVARLVPTTFGGLVAARLSALSDPQRRVLSAAAVIGGEPDVELLTAATGLDAAAVLEALRAATDRQLLAVTPTVLIWRHTLIRDAVLDTVLPPERRDVAQRAADILLARQRGDDESLAVDLLLAAGDADGATAVLLRQAARDIERAAMRSAENELDRAAATGRRDVPVAIDRVLLYTLTGHATRALEVGAAAIDRASGTDHAEICLRLARAAIVAGRWSDAARYVERAGQVGDSRASVLRADAAHGAGRVAEAVEFAHVAVGQAERDQRPDVLCEALCIVGRLARLSDPPSGLAAFRRAAQVAAEYGLRPWRVEALLGMATLEMLDLEVPPPTLLEARDLAFELGLVNQAASAQVILTEHAYTAGGPAAIVAPAGRLIQLGADLRLPYLQTLGQLFMAISFEASGPSEERERCLRAAGGWDGASSDTLAQIWAVRAVPLLRAGDLVGAAALLDRFAQPLVDYPAAAPLAHFGLWALVRTVIGGPTDDARQVLRGLPAGLRRANRGALHYADAVAHGRSDRPDDATRAFDAGETDLAPVPYWHRLLRLFTLQCALSDGWGNPVPLLRADLAAHEAGRDDDLARICRDLLRRAGAGTRRGRGDSPVPPGLRALGITSRELDVLRLVASGLTNTEVADRLYLSRRTVETHVSTLLARTGATSRGELRAVLDRLTP